MRNCPLCNSSRRVDYPYKTYATCLECQHTYQPKPPIKTYQNPDETGLNGSINSKMGEHEKAVNHNIATWLFQTIRPSTVLDIGSAYPYLAYCFKQLGVKEIAVDGAYKENEVKVDLPVNIQAVNWEDLEDGGYDSWKGVDLITMIHVLEHFIDPIACLERVYDNLSVDGTLYLRSPNKDVSGIERDHTDGHTLIHPNIFGEQSIIYAMKRVGFHLHWREHLENHGQSSWIFKKRPPKISLFMIVKNEQDNIVDCLTSVREHVDEMIILDTGSSDNTIKYASKLGAKVLQSKQYDSNTKYKDFNFSSARNEAMRYATGDWLFWMDADDRFEGSNLTVTPDFDAYHLQIKYGDTEWTQVRLFRNHWGVHFKGALHEFPTVDSCRLATMINCAVRHKDVKKPDRIERNISILENEYKRDSNNKRTIFYLANAYRENQQYEEAIRYYLDYVARGGNFHDELAVAKYYIALSHYCKRDYNNALKAAHEAITFDDRWGEPYSLAGECYFFKRQFKKAASYFRIAYEMPFPQTTMFVQKDRYRKIPPLWLSYCYEHLGELEEALKWAKGNKIREKQLLDRTYIIELNRPGARGDVLCTTPVVREIRKRYPKAFIRYVTHKTSKGVLEHNPDIDEIVEKSNKHADRHITFIYPMREGYPYTPLNRHITQYFAEDAGVKLPSDWKPILNLVSDDIVKLEHKKPIITFAVKTGWSHYKEWPLERWEKLVSLFPEYAWLQLGAADEPMINGAQHMCGKLTFRESFSVLQQSILFVGLDSIFNHVAAAFGTPAIILFGSTSPIGHGYKMHVNLWSEYSCSPCYRENNQISVHPMSPCPYSHKCMQEYMSVDRVVSAIKQRLNIKYGQSYQSKPLPTASE